MPPHPDEQPSIIDTLNQGLLHIGHHIDPATGDRYIRLTLQNGTHRDITPAQARDLAEQILEALNP
ncbi:hypothetical protein [Rhodococcoides fascians]|uniref:hypothetical protein n=1 Tax=Rhodococcoides fascians TaxID=1828 RepID=UPI00050D0854|nr:hypothetical protein [Rhodococcus fascians]